MLSHFGKTDSIDIQEADEIIRMMEELKEKAGYNE